MGAPAPRQVVSPGSGGAVGGGGAAARPTFIPGDGTGRQGERPGQQLHLGHRDVGPGGSDAARPG